MLREHRESWRGLLIVFGAFLLSVLLFGAFLIVPAIGGMLGEPEQPEAAQTPGVGIVRTVVLWFHDGQGELTGAVAVTGDTRRLRMTAVGYPVETEVAVSGQRQSLKDAYRADRKAALVALCEAGGIEAQTGISFSDGAVTALMLELQNGLPYLLPETAGDLPAGATTLTPLQVGDLILYDKWREPTGAATVHAGLTAALFNRYLTADRVLTEVFGTVADLCDERLNISQFVAVQDELERLAEQNRDGTICTSLVAGGEWIAGNTRFALNSLLHE